MTGRIASSRKSFRMKSSATASTTPTHALRVNVSAMATASAGMTMAAHVPCLTSKSSRATAAQITSTSRPE